MFVSICGEGYKYITRNCKIIKAYVCNADRDPPFVELWYCEDEEIYYVVIKDFDGLHIYGSRCPKHADMMFTTAVENFNENKQM